MARFNAGMGPATLTSSETSSYNDGQQHSVTFIKKGRRIVMYIDDEEVDSGDLPLTSQDVIRASDSGGLFLGGVRPMIDVGDMAMSDKPLNGCISNLIVDGLILDMYSTKNHFGIETGLCRANTTSPTGGEWVPPGQSAATPSGPDTPQPTPSTTFATLPGGVVTVFTVPTTTTAQTTTVTMEKMMCAKDDDVAEVEGSLHFGDVENSHATININKAQIPHNNGFTIDIEYRTFEGQGLIFYAIGKNNDYVALQLINNKLELMNPRLEKPLTSSGGINDGLWKNVRIEKVKNELSLYLNDTELGSGRIRKRLNIAGRAYVGGVPSALASELAADVAISSLKGCVRRLKIQDRTYDMSEARTTQDVKPCLENVQAGAYFTGESYATYEEYFDVSEQLKIELEFRTNKLNTILAVVGNRETGREVAVQIVDGSLIWTVASGDREFNVTFNPNEEYNKYSLCDGQWHSLVGMSTNMVISLKIDARNVKFGIMSGGPLPSVSMEASLYIGGKPEDESYATLLKEENLMGCIRHLYVNSQRAFWSSLAGLHNVQVNSCPQPSP